MTLIPLLGLTFTQSQQTPHEFPPFERSGPKKMTLIPLLGLTFGDIPQENSKEVSSLEHSLSPFLGGPSVKSRKPHRTR